LTRTDETQRRLDYRSSASYPLWYRDLGKAEDGGDWIRSVSRDLSGGGACFEMPDTPPVGRKPGDLLEVQVIVPPTPVFAIAEVVRTFQDDRGVWYAGVMFASIDARDRDRIVRAVLREGVRNR
jgi:c-di-GMP-binding flagellar brake protein YcgR